MRKEVKSIVFALIIPALFVLILWLLWLLESGLDTNWHNLGIYPRSTHLIGILTSPLVHASAKHLFSNSIPLLILGWCLFYFYKDISFGVIPCLWVLSGIFIWCFGREAWHIGASSLIYAFSFFLFFSGLIRRYIPLIAVSLFVAFLYGSTVWNMFPLAELVDPKVSWEGHLSGAASGLICAFLFRNYGPQKPIEEDEEEEDDEESSFMSDDTQVKESFSKDENTV